MPRPLLVPALLILALASSIPAQPPATEAPPPTFEVHDEAVMEVQFLSEFFRIMPVIASSPADQECLNAARHLYHGFEAAAKDETLLPAQLKEAEAAYTVLRQHIATLPVTWHKDAVEVDPRPLRLTQGIPRPVFLEVTNATSDTLHLAREPRDMPPTMVPPGQTRPMLRLLEGEPGDQSLLLQLVDIFDDSNPPQGDRKISLRVAVEDPATVRVRPSPGITSVPSTVRVHSTFGIFHDPVSVEEGEVPIYIFTVPTGDATLIISESPYIQTTPMALSSGETEEVTLTITQSQGVIPPAAP